jgi:death-on-curing protein
MTKTPRRLTSDFDIDQQQPVWISRVMADAIHSDLVSSLGGSLGTRDSGLIDSALDRPRNRFAYNPTADLAELAAAYGFRLTKNHGYMDANKRTAYQVAFVFLRLNGYRIVCPEAEVVDTMLAVAKGDATEAQLANWLRAHAKPT